MNEDLPILQDVEHLKTIESFVKKLELLPSLNEIAEQHVCFIDTSEDGDRYSFTMISDNLAVMLKETVDKVLLMSKVVIVLSDTFEKTEYLLPDFED